MRMAEPRGDCDLTEEPLSADYRGKLRAQHLHRHLTMVFHVLGEIHRRLAAGPEFPLDVVATGQGADEAVELIGHGGDSSAK